MPGSTVTTKPGFELATQPQRLQPELGALGLAIPPHPDLAEVLHVVDVEAHHVAHAAGEEHGVGAGGQGLVGVALHQPEALHALGDDPRSGKVDVAVGNPGRQHRHRGLVGLELELVDRPLPSVNFGLTGKVEERSPA